LIVCAFFVLMPVLPFRVRPKHKTPSALWESRAGERRESVPATWMSADDAATKVHASTRSIDALDNALSSDAVCVASAAPAAGTKARDQSPRRPPFRSRSPFWWWHFLTAVAIEARSVPGSVGTWLADGHSGAQQIDGGYPPDGTEATFVKPGAPRRLHSWGGLVALAASILLLFAGAHVFGVAKAPGVVSPTISTVLPVSDRGSSKVEARSSNGQAWAPFTITAVRFRPPAGSAETASAELAVVALHVRLTNTVGQAEPYRLSRFSLHGFPSGATYAPQLYPPLLDTLLVDDTIGAGASAWGDVAFYVPAGDTRFDLRYAASARTVLSLRVR
jgi:hypothetical protein